MQAIGAYGNRERAHKIMKTNLLGEFGIRQGWMLKLGKGGNGYVEAVKIYEEL